GVRVTPTSGLVTTEAGGAASFTIVLNTQPSASVSISISSSNTSEGTVSPNSVTFSTSNWNAPQTVTVTGVDDSIADGDQLYTIVTGSAVSTGLDYNGLPADDVSVQNRDNETAGVIVSPFLGLQTTEEGGTATFVIVLNSQPTGSVTIGLMSSNT